jgi:ABC-type nickel/cobalt efflux system permease component RcnA
MTQDSLVIYLIAATFGLVVLVGIYQWFRTRRAIRNHEHSAVERPRGQDSDLRGDMTRRHR